MKRIGLMGCGTVARYGHIPTIQATPGLTLAAVYDPVETACRSAQEQFQVPQGFTNMEDFLKSGIDAVAITSPAPWHRQNVLDAARFGKHILCEKPLGMTDGDVREMIQAVGKAGVMLFTAFDYRFSPVAQTIRHLVKDRAVGDVRSLRLIYIWNMHGKYVTVDGRRVLSARRCGGMEEGGPLFGCGVHQIDLARWWLNSEVVRWSAAGAWVDEFAAPDHVYLHMDHEQGAHTMVEMSYTYAHTAAEPISHFSYHLIGTEGVIRYDRESRVFEVRDTRGTRQYPFASEKNFAGMYVAFAEALEKGGSDVLPTSHDGLMATRIARSAVESVMAGRWKGDSKPR